MKIEQGAIYLAQVGAERRPLLVISNDDFNSNSKFIMIAPITSTYLNNPMRISLEGYNLATTGYVIVDQARGTDILSREPKYVEKVTSELLDIILSTFRLIF